MIIGVGQCESAFISLYLREQIVPRFCVYNSNTSGISKNSHSKSNYRFGSKQLAGINK